MTTLSYKIAVVGPAVVGKSTLSAIFCRTPLPQPYDPTIEERLYTQTTLNDDHPCTLELIDTSGYDEYLTLVRDAVDEADGVMLVFALDQHTSLDETMRWWQSVRLHRGPLRKPAMLVGTKADIVYAKPLAPNQDHGRHMATQLCMTYAETTSRSPASIDMAFGELAYAMHMAHLQERRRRVLRAQRQELIRLLDHSLFRDEGRLTRILQGEDVSLEG